MFRQCTLEELLRSDEYASTVEDADAENLLTVWHTRRNLFSLIKYSNTNKKAFILSTPWAVEWDMECFKQMKLPPDIDYLNEYAYCRILESKLGVHKNQFFQNNNISNNDIRFFVEKFSQFKELLKLGFTTQQLNDLDRFKLYNTHLSKVLDLLARNITPAELTSIDVQRLRHYFETPEPNDPEKLLTLRQILGLNHLPKAFSAATIENVARENPTETLLELLYEEKMSVDQFENLPGMTMGKINLIYTHADEVKKYVAQGLRLVSFAKVEEARLSQILANPSVAQKALQYVNPQELFALHRYVRPCAFGFFEKKPDEEKVPDEDYLGASCTIM